MISSNAKKTKQMPEGMILVYVLAILALIAMMGFVLVSNSMVELSVSGNNRTGREAFNTADSTERIATLISRILLHPELGSPTAILSTSSDPKFPMTVEIDTARFNLAKLQQESTNFDYLQRYLDAQNSDPLRPPHIVFKVGDKEVASAVVNMEIKEPISEGYSLGVGDMYDFSAGSGVQINLVITIDATPMSIDNDFDDPHSIVTSIYRELL
ncbi:MAG: hypothetical protein LBP22_13790 [Deltaproteobacteria bacterium]|jgi:hypothetical protein|nr:hypothetical protein [Deltaproteobacteria bacterium]